MMTREQRAGLARLMLHWPERREALRLAGASDDLLLELCETYDLACDASAYWSKSTLPGADEIADDYRTSLPSWRLRLVSGRACLVGSR